MKKLLGFFLLVSLVSCAMERKKYRITNGNSEYYTDNYSKNAEGCITFENDRCRCGSNQTEPVTICGNYTITTLNR